MTKTLVSIGAPVLLSRVRRQRCKTKGCTEKSRMALVVPLSDIDPENGGPGLGAIVQCGRHLEEALVSLTNADREAEYEVRRRDRRAG